MYGWLGRDIRETRHKSLERFSNFLVFDIETVLDSEMFDAIADDREKERKENGEFLPNPFHKIVAFSFILIKDRKIEAFQSFSLQNEKELISIFWQIFRKAHSFKKNKTEYTITNFPVLITVNGKDFDMPVIKLRTLKYIKFIDDKDSLDETKKDLSIKQFISIYMDRFDKWEETFPRYTNKYTPYHIDLATDIFGGRKISLKKMCYLCDIPVKQEGEGDIVEDLFKEGNLSQIAKYCAEDVKATALLFAYLNEHLFDGAYKFASYSDIQKTEAEILTL